LQDAVIDVIDFARVLACSRARVLASGVAFHSPRVAGRGKLR
jgi:hypothetical protein